MATTTPQSPPFELNNCIYLDGQTPCGADFYGYPVEKEIYPTYGNFSSAIDSLSDPDQLSARFAAIYGCVAGTPLLTAMRNVRFVQSFWCSEVVYYALAGFQDRPAQCAAPTGTPGIRPFGPILCEAQCTLASKGLIDILSSPELCPSPTNDNLLRRQLYAQYCADMNGANSRNTGVGVNETCIRGTQSDLKWCGE
jgi:hypothetical protein